MRIFLTGGTGQIGSAVLDALIRAGHQVNALVRNSERAAVVQARGAQAVLGDILRPASYADSVAVADGVVLAAFDAHKGPEGDAVAIDTVLKSLSGADRFVIYTSGMWVLGDQPSAADETAALAPPPVVSWRPPLEARILEAAATGLRTAVVRSGIVYGGARGIISDLLRDAANGLIRVVGAGDNHWPLIYDRDLADLYVRLTADSSAAGLFHANDQGDERVADIIAAVAEGVPVEPSVRHVPLPEARKKMGPLADALVLDQIVRSPRARQLGWSPSLHSVSGNVARLFEEWRRGKEAA